MSAPFTDKPNPYSVLTSEVPAADNVPLQSGGGGDSNAAMRAGEVMPGDVAGYVAPTAASTTPATRATEESSAEDAGTQGASGMSSLSAAANSTTEAVAPNDSPLAATVAAVSGAESEQRAREAQQQGQEAHQPGAGGPTTATPTSSGGGGDSGQGFQPVSGGIAAADRAAGERGIGAPPVTPAEDSRAAEGGSGSAGSGGGSSKGGVLYGLAGTVGQAVGMVTKGIAGMAMGGRKGEAGAKEAEAAGGSTEKRA